MKILKKLQIINNKILIRINNNFKIYQRFKKIKVNIVFPKEKLVT